MAFARGISIARLALTAALLALGVWVSAELSRTTPEQVPAWWVSWSLLVLFMWAILGVARLAAARRAVAPESSEFPLRGLFVPVVEAALPRGESLVNFVPAIVAPPVQGKVFLSRPSTMTAYGLALTTVGLRLMSFGPAGATRRSAGGTLAVTGEVTIRMSEITSVQFSRVTCLGRDAVVKELGRRFGSPLVGVKRWHPVRLTGLEVTTVGRRGLTVWSMHREIDTLVSNLNALRSGDFLASRTSSVVDAMERLHRMVADGVMTQDECDRVKAGFVGSAMTYQESTESRIRQLHSLMHDGILTPSEFRQKKWDLLSRTT